MKIRIALLTFFSLFFFSAWTQMDARLFRYPDVSDKQIAFVYGGDIWLVPKEGGLAYKITSSPGEESFPRFSPDGKSLAYSANYNGNTDVYLMSLQGGGVSRLTYNSFPDRIVDWHPDGHSLLIASGKESGTPAYRQFYSLSVKGGLPDKLPIPYGELGSYSPDGSKLAYVTRITENFPFKRYRGGMASDVVVFDLNKQTAMNITKNSATDGKPAWHKNRIYYVSDAGTQKRRNIWVYHTERQTRQQITQFTDFDINHMSIGPEELVFEAGGKLYLLNLDNHRQREIQINVVADLASTMSRNVRVSNMIRNFQASPDGKRVMIEARGELFNVPAEHGYVQNTTNASGSYERMPAWSPDGKYVAYWSDRSGENEIYLKHMGGKLEDEPLSKFGGGYGFRLFWSPDSKKIALVDYMQAIKIIDLATKEVTVADHTRNMVWGSLNGFQINWSADNKWLAYYKFTDNTNPAIFVYNLDTKKVNQLTSGYYNDYEPVFDPKGKYLYFFTDRAFQPSYSSLDATWIYPNTTQIAALSLQSSTASPLAPRNDEIKITEEKKPGADTAQAKKPEAGKAKDSVVIDFENAESRLVILPVPAGNLGNLNAVEGKIIYHRRPNTGAGGNISPVQFYDLEKREEKSIYANANRYVLAPTGSNLVVQDNGRIGIIKINPDQKIDKALRTAEMTMSLVPKEEWTQLFNDTWRRYRDFFYDPGMQQVDWPAMKAQYGALIQDAITRLDVTNILIELISELSAGHTYAGGGDMEQVEFRPTGFLGIDWTLDQGGYKIKRIVRPAAWDNEVRSPFDRPGIEVKEGDYLFSVNGIAIDRAKDPYAAFEGLAGSVVSIRVGKTTNASEAKEVIVETLNPQQEGRLRHLEWIESNRKAVDLASNGKLGYMYMPNTGTQGQTELLRQFYAQVDKKGFVIDERFNAGGQLGDRFLEMLNRPTVYYIGWRNGYDLPIPTKANDGPKVMLINGWAGSGGDAFPWGFQQLKMGPIVGERTLGILVGPATTHQLIDNGTITVPDARLFGTDGKWFAEGHGIEPTIEVWDDPAALAKGRDPQLLRAVDETMKLLTTQPRKLQSKPPFEDRTARGIKD